LWYGVVLPAAGWLVNLISSHVEKFSKFQDSLSGHLAAMGSLDPDISQYGYDVALE